LVFPQEIDGLSEEEIRQHRPELAGVIDKIKQLKK
jgi:hypothetical protein